MNVDDAREVAQQLVAESERLGLTWTMRCGTVQRTVDNRTAYVVLDGDDSETAIPMIPLTVLPYAGQRVYTVHVPPAGDYILGGLAPVIGIESGTPDASGYLIITHGLPWTPRVIFGQNADPDSGGAGVPFVQFVVDGSGVNATNFRIRCFTNLGAVVTSVVTFWWIAYP